MSLVVIGLICLTTYLVIKERRERRQSFNDCSVEQLECFFEKQKKILNNPTLNRKFSKFFEKIKDKKSSEKFHLLLKWASDNELTLPIVLTFYEIECTSKKQALGLDWTAALIFTNLWLCKSDWTFSEGKTTHKLNGSFTYFVYDHDDDPKTPDLNILYYVYNENYYFCGCFKEKEEMDTYTFIIKNLEVPSSLLDVVDYCEMYTFILKLVSNFVNKEKKIDNIDLSDDYYKILGIKKTATKDEIKKAYHVLAKKYHPDVYKGSDATRKMMDINKAYEILKNDFTRSAYDNNKNMDNV